MSLVAEIGTYLQSEGHGTLGTDLFLSRLPDSPDSCVAVFPYEGMPPAHTFGQDNIYRLPRFQVMVRGTDYATIHTLAEAIYQSLHFVGQTLSGATYARCEATQSEFLPDRDGNERIILRCNYEAMRNG